MHVHAHTHINTNFFTNGLISGRWATEGCTRNDEASDAWAPNSLRVQPSHTFWTPFVSSYYEHDLQNGSLISWLAYALVYCYIASFLHYTKDLNMNLEEPFAPLTLAIISYVGAGISIISLIAIVGTYCTSK